MSVRVIGWVWEHAPVKGNDLLVLLAVADAANHDGSNAYPGVNELRRKTRLPERTVREALAGSSRRGCWR